LIYIDKKSVLDALSLRHQHFAKMVMMSFMLWLISKKPRHGYEIIGILNKEVCYGQVGAGHVYPILQELAQEGLIKAKEVAHGKRLRKHYTITASGEKRLLDIKKAFFASGMRTQFMKEMIG